MTKLKPGFKSFLTKFPKATLPLELNEETLRNFTLKNKPLSNQMVTDFCMLENEPEPDDFTEFVACCRIPDFESLYPLIYWQGGLLEYYYHLAIFDKKGELVTKKIVGGTKVTNEMLEVVVATVKSNKRIEVRETKTDVAPTAPSEDIFLAPKNIEITETGQVVIPTSFLVTWQ